MAEEKGLFVFWSKLTRSYPFKLRLADPPPCLSQAHKTHAPPQRKPDTRKVYTQILGNMLV